MHRGPSNRTRWRTILLVKLGLCTLAGAVVTWAVAWGCAAAHPFQHAWPEGTYWIIVDGAPVRARRSPGLASECWELLYMARNAELLKFEREHGDAEVFWPRGKIIPVPAALEGSVRLRPDWVRLVHVHGWPTGAMRHLESSGPGAYGLVIEEAVQIMWGARPVDLPARVIPIGFAINTLLAAGVLFLMVEVAALARRRHRAHKGRCPICNYDRSGLADAATTPCPECGLVPKAVG